MPFPENKPVFHSVDLCTNAIQYSVKKNVFFLRESCMLRNVNSHFREGNLYSIKLREAAKKSSSLNGRAIKAYPPPPLEHNGHWNVGTLEKKVPKKVHISFMARRPFFGRLPALSNCFKNISIGER